MFCQAESFMLLQKDSKLAIVPLSGGKTSILKCNSENMNSWHSWSPNSKWVIYSSKALGPYTQLFLTHINADGTDTPPVYLDKFSFPHYANNIPDMAIHYLKAATRLNGEDYNSQYYLGLSYFDENKFMEAEQAFSSGIKNCKEPSLFPLMHEMRGNALVKLGYLEQAIQDFDASIRYAPNDPSSYYEKGKILFKLRREQEGENCLRQAAQLGSQKAARFLVSPNK